MRKFFIILTFLWLFINPVCSSNSVMKKDYSVKSSDGFSINATLQYNKIRGKKDFHTVVLLHSLGYSSEWWSSLPSELLNSGYAVVQIDLRGHGKSIYNDDLIKTSWKSLTNSAFEKYPSDVVNIIDFINSENSKKKFFNEWAIIGADIGASTAILASDSISYKPKTMVLMSPIVETKGLYVPVKLANLDFDILSISGTNDNSSIDAQKYLSRFAQKTFATYTSPAKTTGMLMLKHDETLSKVITSWIKEYL